MGWFSDWWYKDDPRAAIQIDQSLEEYLKKQNRGGYKPTSGEESSDAFQHESYREQIGLKRNPQAPKLTKSQLATPANAEEGEESEEKEKPLPAESLFQDGRYKDIWANYRPQAEVEDEVKTDQERMSDIARGWRQRSADITRAATENCANESFAVHDCFRSGGWKSRMTMCREENRSLIRCITMQRRFLNALGFLTIWDRTAEESERIQMHADKLYHQMLEQERLIQEAKDKGEPIPQFEDLLDPNKKYKPGYKVRFDDIPEETKQKILANRLKDLDGPALELGKRAVEADIERNADAAWQIDDHYWLNRKHREERYLEGTESAGDKLRRWHETKYRNRPFPEKPAARNEDE